MNYDLFKYNLAYTFASILLFKITITNFYTECTTHLATALMSIWQILCKFGLSLVIILIKPIFGSSVWLFTSFWNNCYLCILLKFHCLYQIVKQKWKNLLYVGILQNFFIKIKLYCLLWNDENRSAYIDYQVVSSKTD